MADVKADTTRDRWRIWLGAGLALAFGFAAAYGLGAYSHAADLWPIGALRNLKRAAAGEPAAVIRFDRFGRLLAFPGKTEVACPSQGPRTAVLVVFGGSNAGNWTGQRVATATGRAFNYIDGKCTAAASPLLGADNIMGEYWTLLADRLIERGLYDDVVLSVASVGGSTAQDWAPGGRLAGVLSAVATDLGSRYRATRIIWDMGEDDALPRHDPERFSRDYERIVAAGRSAGLTAPVYLTLATKCLPDDYPWKADNPIARAERMLPARIAGLSLGVDRDALIRTIDRRDDCHLGATGADKMAQAWAERFAADR